jgi:hypothetical protein
MALLLEALDAKPDDCEFALKLIDLWRSDNGVGFDDRISEARGRWPTNTVFAAQTV